MSTTLTPGTFSGLLVPSNPQPPTTEPAVPDDVDADAPEAPDDADGDADADAPEAPDDANGGDGDDGDDDDDDDDDDGGDDGGGDGDDDGDDGGGDGDDDGDGDDGDDGDDASAASPAVPLLTGDIDAAQLTALVQAAAAEFVAVFKAQVDTCMHDMIAQVTAAVKPKRGRPLGSKNRPKDDGTTARKPGRKSGRKPGRKSKAR